MVELAIKSESYRRTSSSKYRAGIRKRLRGQGIDSKESVPPSFVVGRAGTTNRVVVLARHAT
jgi:hypothetical protein